MSKNLALVLLLSLTACAPGWNEIREAQPRAIETLSGNYQQIANCLIVAAENDGSYLTYRLLDDLATQTARISGVGANPHSEILLQQVTSSMVMVEVRQRWLPVGNERWQQHLEYARRCSERRAG